MNLKVTINIVIFTTASLLTFSTLAAEPLIFSGSGAAATSSLDAFKLAVKTARNKDASRISWDGVKLDGTDANSDTRVIDFNKTVVIPVDRFRNVGVLFADRYTVSADGFASVNPASAGQFPAFSANNTFAMFDPKDGQFEDRNIQQKFILLNTNDDAGTRGFGAIFVDVEINGSSSIEYFGKDAQHNKISLGKYYVGAGSASGEAQFLGVVFDAPVVSEIEITLGSKSLFSFDGRTVKAFGAEDLAHYVDLVVSDDFFFAEPEALASGVAKVSPADCLFNWAEKKYPTLFSQAASQSLYYAPYYYRYYANPNYFLGVSSYDYHVHFTQNPAGYINDAGEFLAWLHVAGCQ